MIIHTAIVGNPLNYFLLRKLFKVESKFAGESTRLQKQQIRNITQRQPFKVYMFPRCRGKTQARMERLGRSRVDKVLEIDHFIKS